MWREPSELPDSMEFRWRSVGAQLLLRINRFRITIVLISGDLFLFGSLALKRIWSFSLLSPHLKVISKVGGKNSWQDYWKVHAWSWGFQGISKICKARNSQVEQTWSLSRRSVRLSRLVRRTKIRENYFRIEGRQIRNPRQAWLLRIYMPGDMESMPD